MKDINKKGISRTAIYSIIVIIAILGLAYYVYTAQNQGTCQSNHLLTQEQTQYLNNKVQDTNIFCKDATTQDLCLAKILDDTTSTSNGQPVTVTIKNVCEWNK